MSVRRSATPVATRSDGIRPAAATSAAAHPGDQRRVDAHRPRLGAEGHALLVHPVESARVDEGEGLPLFHEERDAVGECPNHLRAPHERQGLHAGHGAARVQAPEALAGSEPGGLDHLVGGEPALSRDFHALDGEARGLEHGGGHGGERAAQHGQQHADTQPCRRRGGSGAGVAAGVDGGRAAGRPMAVVGSARSARPPCETPRGERTPV